MSEKVQTIDEFKKDDQAEKAKTIKDVLDVAQTYINNPESLTLIKKAYDIADECHKGQFRKSGEPYVQHPIEVAYILAQLHTGPSTIAAGLVHDVIEDTDMTEEKMAELLGKDVSSIVDGVTKISKLKYMTKDKALAHDHQKILLAMSKDIRVVLVKLVDRLHNMRTLQYHNDQEKQMRIAKETLDLYAPLAHRLGMYRIKAELEDLSLKYLSKTEYDEIAAAIVERKSEREDDIAMMIELIKKMLDSHNIKDYDIRGRIKNIYSIYKKIVSKNKTMDDIYDLLALRVIVNSIEECYQVLGLIHGEWTPLPRRFKDYIAVPKSNMYQSLHTTVVGPNGKIFEIQIRTYEMDTIAEYGVAAHWAYKEGAEYVPEKEQIEISKKLKWYKDLSSYVEMSSDKDPLDNIIEDIFDANVYVFTPKGDVIDLPAGSMPLDFAYRIHSRVGDTTVGAIVNGKIVPLSYKLKTGDVVEIKTNKNISGPTKDWLKHAKTSHARHKIKAFINKQKRDEFVLRGQNEFEKYAKQFGYNVSQLDDKKVKELFERNNISSLEDLYYEIGCSNYSPQVVLNRILGINDIKFDDEQMLEQYSEENAYRRVSHAKNNAYGVIVEGLDKPHIKLANCCQPVYGDKIYGYISKGYGIIVHREGCPNMLNDESERYIEVNWEKDFSGYEYDTTLKIHAIDKRNLVAEMINAVNATKVTITSVTSTKDKSGQNITKFKLKVKNIDELNHVILLLGKISEIYDIERYFK